MCPERAPKPVCSHRLTAGLSLLALWLGCTPPPAPITVPVSPSLEDRTPDGGYYTPGTQSFLRGSHWLEGIASISFLRHSHHRARVSLIPADSSRPLTLVNLPLDYLVPRLHYRLEGPPDEFDALNLRLAEYSRNSISVPSGKPGDAMAHFETDLPDSPPWRLRGDYDFQPVPRTRPVRVGLINNCLDPGLWEISAGDRAGEIYHAWFTMPKDFYLDFTAEINRVPRDFLEGALVWSGKEAPLHLDRLREVLRTVGEMPLTIHHEPLATGFSSQDSRRKLARGFARVQDAGSGSWRAPVNLDELTAGKVRLTEFAPPGKYILGGYQEFDLTFLKSAKSVQVNLVKPKTCYDMSHPGAQVKPAFDYLELVLFLDGYRVIIGNLPLQLLSPREDFTLNGYGVGILHSSDFAERREFLIAEGPAPSFAYLVRESDGELLALNSHTFGLEQIFLRTHLEAEGAWWECTLTSYERIVDIIKYRVPVPDEMVALIRQQALEYISPIYLTYRDDNLR